MLGAITGDVVGSIYEWNNIKTKKFRFLTEACFFTDDTVLSVALAESILSGVDFVGLMKSYYRRYPGAGYGGRFHSWARSDDTAPYNSWGNGAAMRISPVSYAFDTLDEVLQQAECFTAVTHNHPEGIKGAQATAAAIFIGRTGGSRTDIRNYLESNFGYNLSQQLDAIRPGYRFDESCQGTVPQALIAFLESVDFEDAVRNAISIGGDSDTLACITGAVAEAFYGGVPPAIATSVLHKLDGHLRKVTQEFRSKYVKPGTGPDASRDGSEPA